MSAAGATTTTVTLSLPALIEELKHHIADDRKKPALDKLVAQAQHPEKHAQVKQQLGTLASQAEMRAAVNAIIDRNSLSPATAEPTHKEGAAASGAAAPAAEMTPALSAVFGNMTKDDFRASLIHAFHCRTPSCPVKGCAETAAKLERLHQHVSACSQPGCVLCRMWSGLKYYRDSAAGGQSMQANGGLYHAMYAEPLLQSQQLLPRLQNGKISWVPSADALQQIQELTAGVPAEATMNATGAVNAADATTDTGNATEGEPPSKRQRAGRMPASAAAAAQGSAMLPPLSSTFHGLPSGGGLGGLHPSWQNPSLNDVVRSINGTRSGGSAAAGSGAMPRWTGLHSVPHLPTAWQQHGAPADGGSAPFPGQGSVMLPPPSLLDELASWPESDFDAGRPLSNLAGVPMAKERSGLSLGELIKLRSNSDLNLSFAHSRSDLRNQNFSEISFGSVLENASDLNDILPEF